MTTVEFATPVQELLPQVEERMRPENSEVYRLFGDASKLQSFTDWKPAYTLEQGLKKTIAWFLEREK